MNVTVTNQPCILLEEMELFYAYVNGIPAADLTTGGRYSIPEAEVAHMMEVVCGDHDPAEPLLQFFFQREEILDTSGLYTCLARNLVRNTLDFECPDLEHSLASLRRGWIWLRTEQERICSIQEYALEYEADGDPEPQGNLSLAEEINQLAVSERYRKKLLEAFSDYGGYLEQLATLLRPGVDCLLGLMEPWIRRAEPLVKIWEDSYSRPDAMGDLLRAVCYNSDIALGSLHVCLRYFGDNVANGRMDGCNNSVTIHAGVARVPEVVVNREIKDWEYHALRLLDSPARIKMLQAMQKRPMTLREIARELQLHLGTVGRDVSSMHKARLLIVDYSDGRSFYRTNAETLNLLARRLRLLSGADPQDME